jgi:hypothetical protein
VPAAPPGATTTVSRARHSPSTAGAIRETSHRFLMLLFEMLLFEFQAGDDEGPALQVLIIRKPFAERVRSTDHGNCHAGPSGPEADDVARLELIVCHLGLLPPLNCDSADIIERGALHRVRCIGVRFDNSERTFIGAVDWPESQPCESE